MGQKLTLQWHPDVGCLVASWPGDKEAVAAVAAARKARAPAAGAPADDCRGNARAASPNGRVGPASGGTVGSSRGGGGSTSSSGAVSWVLDESEPEAEDADGDGAVLGLALAVSAGRGHAACCITRKVTKVGLVANDGNGLRCGPTACIAFGTGNNERHNCAVGWTGHAGIVSLRAASIRQAGSWGLGRRQGSGSQFRAVTYSPLPCVYSVDVALNGVDAILTCACAAPTTNLRISNPPNNQHQAPVTTCPPTQDMIDNDRYSLLRALADVMHPSARGAQQPRRSHGPLRWSPAVHLPTRVGSVSGAHLNSTKVIDESKGSKGSRLR